MNIDIFLFNFEQKQLITKKCNIILHQKNKFLTENANLGD